MTARLGLRMSKLTLLIIIAAAVVVVLLFLSPVRSASTNPCSTCHASKGYSQTLGFLVGNSGNQLPSTISVGETRTVTVVLRNQVNTPSNTVLSGASVTLKSQFGRFSVTTPTFSVGNFPSGTVTATWQITGVSAGSDLLVMAVTATNSHLNLQFSDTYSPLPSINVQMPAPTPPPPTPFSSAVPSASPMSTPTPVETPFPTSSPSSSPLPNPTLIPPYNATPTPALNPGQTPPQSPSPSSEGTSSPSATPSSSSSPELPSPPASSTASSLPVSISLLSPSGGEAWWSRTQHALSWSVTGGSGSLSVDLEYSISGMQGPWLTIATNLSNTTSLVWKVPDVRSSDCYVRASVNDSSNPTQIVSTVSAYAFSIVGSQQSLTTAAAILVLIVPIASVIAFIFGLETAKRKPLRQAVKQVENTQQ